MPTKGRGTWWVRAMPSLQRSAAPFEVTSRPRYTTLPASGVSEPESTLSSVVLPAPLGPTMPTASPWFRVRLTPSSTASAPKCFRTSTAARTAASTVLARVRLERRRDGNVGVGRVLADDEVDRPLGHALLPLAADDRRADDVRDRSSGQRGWLRPVEVSHGR